MDIRRLIEFKKVPDEEKLGMFKTLLKGRQVVAIYDSLAEDEEAESNGRLVICNASQLIKRRSTP